MEVISNFWMLIKEFSPYLILGCLISGILSVFLTVEIVQKYLGKKTISSVFIASFLGVPLPLCSCGVIPVSAYLSKHGASKGSVTSFLISTPQTGIDSIFITYGMLGPLFAIYRPVVAFLSGIIGGSLVHALDDDEVENEGAICEQDCCDDSHSTSIIYKIFHYGFVRLPQDIVNPLVIGIALSSFIIVFIEPDYFNHVGQGILGMLIMLILGLPAYVCATASVPIAFALYTKGFSLGAMLVFLMTGPATNITTMSVIYKILGKKNLLIYLGSIIFCSMGAGLILDVFIAPGDIKVSDVPVNHFIGPWMKKFCSILFIGVVINSFRIKYFSKSTKSDNLLNVLHIEGMTCSHCVDSVTKSLSKLKNITQINIELSSGKIEYKGTKESIGLVEEVIHSLGYKIKL